MRHKAFGIRLRGARRRWQQAERVGVPESDSHVVHPRRLLEGAAERGGRIDPRLAQTRKAREQQVDLHLRTLQRGKAKIQAGESKEDAAVSNPRTVNQ